MNRYKLFVNINDNVIKETDEIYEADSPIGAIKEHYAIKKETYEWTVAEYGTGYDEGLLVELHGPYKFVEPDCSGEWEKVYA